ncbi:GNAT family N-acetyltransferase [Frankia sp. RB7]|nr:GNAT family N-acetyltransferase [Frankia sp. RB7]
MIIRRANFADLPAIERIVSDAYRVYIERIGKPPGPMLDDYSAHIRNRAAWVAETSDQIAGVLILIEQTDHLLLDNVAVDPSHHGRGIGRELLNFAEQEAGRRGHREITLYTHEKMSENLAMYPALGWVETERREQNGYQRVFFRKFLGD